MPTSDQQPLSETAALQPEQMTATPEQREQQIKTVAVRVHENLHSQLSFIASLSGTSISEEIRTAIESRIAAAQDDPDLIARAQAAQQRIEREAAARSAAIAGFIGKPAVVGTKTEPTNATSAPVSRRPAAKKVSG